MRSIRDVEVGDARARADPVHEALGPVAVGLLGLHPRAVDPAVAAAGGQEGAGAVRVVDAVDAVAMLAQDRPQRRAEQRRDGVAEPVGPAHGDARGRPDPAVRAVGGHQVASADGAQLAGREVAERGLDAVAQVLDADHLGVEVHVRAAERPQVLQQHGLEVVLGHARRGRRAQDGGLLARRQADRPGRAPGRRRQRARLPSAPLDVDPARADGVLEAPEPEQLHRAQAHRGRARQRRELGPALDEHRLDAEPGERDGGRQPGRSGARHEDGQVVGVGALGHFAGHGVFRRTACQANTM